MRYTKTAFSLVACLALAACATTQPRPPIVETVTVEVPVPVATGCIATGGRPAPVKPLNEQTARDDWYKLAPGAKANAVKGQAGDRMNNADLDRAATSGCK